MLISILRNSLWLIFLCVCSCGYHTAIYLNTDIKNIAVPIFDNQTTWRELEFELTNLVHREIKARTPFRLVSQPEEADIIIEGAIINYYKPVLVEDTQDQVVAAASKMTIQVSIKDQKTGKTIVSKSQTVQGEFIRGASESSSDAEYRGRQNTFEQLSRWVVSLLEDEPSGKR